MMIWPGLKITMGLSNKRRLFIEEYFNCGMNAAEAARKVGYSEKTARQQGQRLLTNVDIKAEIDNRLKEKHLSSDEILARLGDMARADISIFADVADPADLNDEKYRGKTHLIKKLRKTTTFTKKGDTIITTELELHDAQSTLIHLDKRTSPDGSDDKPFVVRVIKGIDTDAL